MSGFIFIALLMTLVVLGAVLFPLLRRSGETPASWPTAAVTVLVIVAGAAALYPLWSKWEWSRPEPAADSPENMVLRLNRRLANDQDDLEGWLMLGQSYATLGQMGSEQGLLDYAQSQYSRSARAYQRADMLAKGKNRDALIGLGEALVAMDREALGGRAGQMFEKALALDPDYVKSILYAAFAAAERKDLPLARTRFQQLLDNNPPEDLREIIEQQLAAMDAEKVAVAAAVAVPVRITIAASVQGKANAGAPLFLVARIPGQRGAPLAAKRLDARFPQEVDLLSTDAMVAGTGFKAGQELEIEARVSNGGSAISRSGDPFGIARVKAGEKTRIAIEINQLKPP
jgi:cytochrome c-type biogenesis protein CcmH